MITYLGRDKNFVDDHSLAIRYVDEILASDRLRKFPIKETKITTEYCSRCNAWHIIRPSMLKV